MRTPRLPSLALLAALVAAPMMGYSAASPAEAEELPQQKWSFNGPFGTFDEAAAQRGFLIYQQVCANCHSMNLLHYRDLSGIGLSEAQIKAIAAAVQVPTLDDSGQPVQRPGLPSDTFKAPFPNELAAKAAMGGALPPDQSVLVNAREDGANYIYDLLTGYVDPPAGMKVADGAYYNLYYPGHQIKMPAPLQDGAVQYTDGTKPTLDQEAHDVVTFLTWASNPEMDARKVMGVRIVLFLVFLTGLTYAVKRRVWSDVH
jgi:ubiquinol-cytochrome c reductase cytochrome c1 subunit